MSYSCLLCLSLKQFSFISLDQIVLRLFGGSQLNFRVKNILGDADVANGGVVVEWERPEALHLGEPDAPRLHPVQGLPVNLKYSAHVVILYKQC